MNLKASDFSKNLKTVLITLSVSLGLILTSSCNKSDDDSIQQISALTVVNAFSGSNSADFYLDNQRVNNQPLDYKLNTGYFNIYPGSRRITATKGGSTTSIIADNLYNFAGGQYFSLFIARKTEANADSAVFVVSRDSVPVTETGKASIRFVNLTPGAHKLDLLIKGGTGTLFTNKAFKEVSKFISVNPSESFILQIKETGSDVGTAPKLELAPFALVAGKIYTVYSNGLWEGTDSSVFGANVIIH